jgi:hypothetical protein
MTHRAYFTIRACYNIKHLRGVILNEVKDLSQADLTTLTNKRVPNFVGGGSLAPPGMTRTGCIHNKSGLQIKDLHRVILNGVKDLAQADWSRYFSESNVHRGAEALAPLGMTR